MQIIEFAAHTALLRGTLGLLALPAPRGDVNDPLPCGELLPDGTPALAALSLHAADWDSALADLWSRGWQPVEAADDEPQAMGALLVGATSDGRELVALELA